MGAGFYIFCEWLFLLKKKRMQDEVTIWAFPFTERETERERVCESFALALFSRSVKGRAFRYNLFLLRDKIGNKKRIFAAIPNAEKE